MKNKNLILGVVCALSMATAEASTVMKKSSASGISVGVNLGIRWLHGKGTLKTKVATEFEAGFVTSADGGGITRPQMTPMDEFDLNVDNRADHPFYRVGQIIPCGSGINAYFVRQDGEAPEFLIDQAEQTVDERDAFEAAPVSYTHLTLPTIYSV